MSVVLVSLVLSLVLIVGVKAFSFNGQTRAIRRLAPSRLTRMSLTSPFSVITAADHVSRLAFQLNDRWSLLLSGLLIYYLCKSCLFSPLFLPL